MCHPNRPRPPSCPSRYPNRVRPQSGPRPLLPPARSLSTLPDSDAHHRRAHLFRDADDGTTHFTVNIIPHTAAHTTLGSVEAKRLLNLEIDVLARYLKRMQSLAAMR